MLLVDLYKSDKTYIICNDIHCSGSEYDYYIFINWLSQMNKRFDDGDFRNSGMESVS